MITGYVNEYYEAIIPVRMRGNIPLMDLIIDTGFRGILDFKGLTCCCHAP